MSTARDLSLFEFKDDDSPELRGMKSYYQMVYSMPEPERKLFLQEERVHSEERELQRMVQSNKKDDEFILYATSRAKQLMKDIQDYGTEDKWLEQAELWTEIAQGTKANKYTIKDIRKQRERVWQEKRRYSTLKTEENAKDSTSLSEKSETHPSDEPKQSSNNSES